ncbi:MAG: hypothetical protein JJU36_10835 [Phycisphaeraceae bacterium]|nr:hypothetical protein [Phycisphaeraceae bacterium]
MINRLLSFVVLLLIVTSVIPAFAAEATFLLTPERLAEIRRQAERRGSPAAEMIEGMRTRIEQGWEDGYRPGFGPGRRTYQSSWLAREAAMMYQITGDRRYVAAAVRELREGVQNATHSRGLNNAFHSVAFGLVYAWCKDAMSAEDRRWVEQRITEGLDFWPRVSHHNFGQDRGSNWVSVSRGGELIMLLASGQHEERADRLRFLVRELQRHIQSAIGSIGYTQEGVGYMSFGGAFLVPGALALEQVAGDSSLADMLRERSAWVFPMFTGATGNTAQMGHQKFLPNGVSNVRFMDEGWVSSLLGLVPAEEMPYFLYFYNRHAGPENRRPVEFRYDSTRAGTVWALLYYPFDVQPRDPVEKYGRFAYDRRGYYFFRNRWGVGDDIMTSIMADTNSHGRAWDQPEALQIALHAYDTTFIAGPATRREPHHYSAPLINDQRSSGGNPQHRRGQSIHRQAHDHGGYVIVGGGEVYRPDPVDDIQRHYFVDFSGATGTDALMSTLDVIKSQRENRYTWNAALADAGGRDGIERVIIGNEAGRPTFILRGRHNSYVKGWVLHPADAQVVEAVDQGAGKDALQIHTRGSDANIWVVMTVGTGNPPAARIAGSGMDTRFQLGRAALRYDVEENRIIHQPAAAGR